MSGILAYTCDYCTCAEARIKTPLFLQWLVHAYPECGSELQEPAWNRLDVYLAQCFDLFYGDQGFDFSVTGHLTCINGHIDHLYAAFQHLLHGRVSEVREDFTRISGLIIMV